MLSLFTRFCWWLAVKIINESEPSPPQHPTSVELDARLQHVEQLITNHESRLNQISNNAASRVFLTENPTLSIPARIWHGLMSISQTSQTSRSTAGEFENSNTNNPVITSISVNSHEVDHNLSESYNIAVGNNSSIETVRRAIEGNIAGYIGRENTLQTRVAIARVIIETLRNFPIIEGGSGYIESLEVNANYPGRLDINIGMQHPPAHVDVRQLILHGVNETPMVQNTNERLETMDRNLDHSL